MGKWKLNTDESDDPRQKSAQRSAGNSTGNPGGNGGPRMGWPGGGIGGGGMGGGHHGNNGSQNGTAQDRDRYNQLLDPSIRLDLERKNDKDPIVEMMGDQGRKTIFYTDGHKPDEPAGVGTEIVEAKWDGAKLRERIHAAKERLVEAHLRGVAGRTAVVGRSGDGERQGQIPGQIPVCVRCRSAERKLLEAENFRRAISARPVRGRREDRRWIRGQC